MRTFPIFASCNGRNCCHFGARHLLVCRSMSDSESSGKLRAPTELVKKQGGSLRIVLIGLGCLTFIALLALGSFFYFAYRIEKEEQRTEKSLTNPSADSSKPSSKVERREVCSLITKEEMKEVIGMEMIEATTNATG